jgi:hypothetical protein
MPSTSGQEIVDHAHEREVLRQTAIALHGRVVTLWEITPEAAATRLFSSIPDAPRADTELDLDHTLRQWGAPLITTVAGWDAAWSAAGSGAWRRAPAPPAPRPAASNVTVANAWCSSSRG